LEVKRKEERRGNNEGAKSPPSTLCLRNKQFIKFLVQKDMNENYILFSS